MLQALQWAHPAYRDGAEKCPLLPKLSAVELLQSIAGFGFCDAIEDPFEKRSSQIAFARIR